MLDSKIVLITGERQTGKSTLCRKMVQVLDQSGFDVAGLLTETVAPHELWVTEIRSGDRYTLTYPFDSDAGIAMTHFRMNPQAMARSANALTACFPTDVFILDELGPLELKRGQGWIQVIHLLRYQTYRVAFIVVRPTLLVDAMWQLPYSVYTVVEVNTRNRDTLPAALTRLVQEEITPSKS